MDATALQTARRLHRLGGHCYSGDTKDQLSVFRNPTHTLPSPLTPCISLTSLPPLSPSSSAFPSVSPHGEGSMTFDDGLVYKGGFYEGMFHGSAIITFPNSSHFQTEWHLNSLRTAAFHYSDGLSYPLLTSPTSTPPSAWSFCTDADRRFASELTRGIALAPLGESQLIDKPGRFLPYKCYDVGDGFLDPTTGAVWGWEGRTQIRQAEEVEVEWAKAKCRIGRDERFTHNTAIPPS